MSEFESDEQESREDSFNSPDVSAIHESSTWILFNNGLNEIKFKCCYGFCSSTFENYGDFESHLCYEHYAKSREKPPGQVQLCGVNGCDMLISDLNFYMRHLIFHCYHAKLQYKGALLFTKDERSSDATICKGAVSSKSNNIFYSGDLMRCLWKDCSACFEDVGIFFAHVNDHIEEDCSAAPSADKKFLACCWLNCSSLFLKKSQLQAHLKHHTGEKHVACPFCGAFFSNATKYFDHVIRQSANENSRLKCFLCNKVFPTQRLLREHSRRHINTRKCPYCDMTAVGPHNLRLHINDRHSDIKKHQCTICFRSFSRKSDLQRHFSRHSTDVVFDCEECGAVFSWKNALLMHKRIHKPPTYACHLCAQFFTHGNLLSRHLVTRHQLCLPSGHKRFIYKKCADGYQRLQTERYESVEMVEELMEGEEKEDEDTINESFTEC